MAGKRKTKTVIPVGLIALIIGVVLIVVPSMLATTVNNSLALSSHTEKAPAMVAHRGLSSLAPQNSLPAFELAAEYGFDGYEFDIHTTKDGKWVVIHDDTVDAMTDGSGFVKDFTLDEIRKLKLDSGNGIEKYDSLCVPTLEETLEINLGKDIFPVVEIKSCDVKYLPELKSTLDKYNLSDKAVIISFEKEYLDAYRQLDGNIDMLYLSSAPTKDDIDWCIERDMGINFYYGNLYKSTAALKYARENNVTIGAWTVDNTVYEDVMVLFGAEIITTNKLLP